MSVALDAGLVGTAATAIKPRTKGARPVQPRVRYNAKRRELNFVSQQFARAAAAPPDIYISTGTLAGSAGGAGVLGCLNHHFTAALLAAVTWDARSLHSTFSMLAEDYDVAATEELSLSASKHFGW